MKELQKHKSIGTTCLIIGIFFFGIILETIAIYQFDKAIKLTKDKEEIKSIKIRLLLSWFLFSFTASTNISSTSYDIVVGIVVGVIITLAVYLIKLKKY